VVSKKKKEEAGDQMRDARLYSIRGASLLLLQAAFLLLLLLLPMHKKHHYKKIFLACREAPCTHTAIWIMPQNASLFFSDLEKKGKKHEKERERERVEGRQGASKSFFFFVFFAVEYW
jgi:hypothetical protein